MRRRLRAALLLAGLGGACVGGDAPEAPAEPAAEPAAPTTDFVHDAQWSPDGARLVVTWDRGSGPRLYGLLTGSSDEPPEPTRGLPLSEGDGAWASWSPDGLWVAYGSGGDLIRMRPDGTGPEVLTSGPATDAEPAFSPDGRRIAFVSAAEGGAPRLHVVEADGGEPRAVMFRAGTEHHHPAWDPNGRRLAVQASGPDGDVIYVVDPETGGSGRVGEGRFPAWSPDGRRIFFSQNDSVFWRPADGGMRRFVVADGSVPRVDPGGTRLAFIRGSWPTSALYVLDLETGAEVRITP